MATDGGRILCCNGRFVDSSLLVGRGVGGGCCEDWAFVAVADLFVRTIGLFCIGH